MWIRIFPDKPVTKKPAETRMGKGKGNPEFWVAVVKPGRILYEMEGVTGGDRAGGVPLGGQQAAHPDEDDQARAGMSPQAARGLSEAGQ